MNHTSQPLINMFIWSFFKLPVTTQSERKWRHVYFFLLFISYYSFCAVHFLWYISHVFTVHKYFYPPYYVINKCAKDFPSKIVIQLECSPGLCIYMYMSSQIAVQCSFDILVSFYAFLQFDLVFFFTCPSTVCPNSLLSILLVKMPKFMLPCPIT